MLVFSDNLHAVYGIKIHVNVSTELRYILHVLYCEESRAYFFGVF